MDLRLDADDLNKCVQCGLCLPSCPTFRVSGDESRSPRGRIALLRQVQDHDAPLTAEVLDAFATCVQCRGCEPACPSSVPYGHLMERARETLADEGRLTPWWQRLALEGLAHPRLLRAGSTALALAQRARMVPARLGLPADLPLRRAPLVSHGAGPTPATEVDDTVWLFTGCVMDAWQRPVHAAAVLALEATGLTVVPTGDAAPCCGALHAHAGLGGRARSLARRSVAALGSDRPVVVDSAGCGAAMKDYGHLLGDADGAAFARRVVDITEILADRAGRFPAVEPLPLRVAIQDPCHLRHVQKVEGATRRLLAPLVAELIELDDQGMCCGAGGAYSVLQPGMAGDISDRKVGAIDRAGADLVVSANPGCSLHLAGAGVEVVHPVELVARALAAGSGGRR